MKSQGFKKTHFKDSSKTSLGMDKGTLNKITYIADKDTRSEIDVVRRFISEWAERNGIDWEDIK